MNKFDNLVESVISKEADLSNLKTKIDPGYKPGWETLDFEDAIKALSRKGARFEISVFNGEIYRADLYTVVRGAEIPYNVHEKDIFKIMKKLKPITDLEDEAKKGPGLNRHYVFTKGGKPAFKREYKPSEIPGKWGGSQQDEIDYQNRRKHLR